MLYGMGTSYFVVAIGRRRRLSMAFEKVRFLIVYDTAQLCWPQNNVRGIWCIYKGIHTLNFGFNKVSLGLSLSL
jgi:hypothetical protein